MQLLWLVEFVLQLPVWWLKSVTNNSLHHLFTAEPFIIHVLTIFKNVWSLRSWVNPEFNLSSRFCSNPSFNDVTSLKHLISCPQEFFVLTCDLMEADRRLTSPLSWCMCTVSNVTWACECVCVEKERSSKYFTPCTKIQISKMCSAHSGKHECTQ